MNAFNYGVQLWCTITVYILLLLLSWLIQHTAVMIFFLFFFFFFRKKNLKFHANMEIVCVKCQNLFSRKIRKDISKCQLKFISSMLICKCKDMQFSSQDYGSVLYSQSIYCSTYHTLATL